MGKTSALRKPRQSQQKHPHGRGEDRHPLIEGTSD
ncbi:hypothetical protein BMETH_147_9 [methanotrophic bacterial endosymbiont of Bathymodiolus sp.]|nr:hypothetical protein BMETH_147_9 [methanotrophic bacterial endosymbiont of Bathymodiolus sp.]